MRLLMDSRTDRCITSWVRHDESAWTLGPVPPAVTQQWPPYWSTVGCHAVCVRIKRVAKEVVCVCVCVWERRLGKETSQKFLTREDSYRLHVVYLLGACVVCVRVRVCVCVHGSLTKLSAVVEGLRLRKVRERETVASFTSDQYWVRQSSMVSPPYRGGSVWVREKQISGHQSPQCKWWEQAGWLQMQDKRSWFHLPNIITT